jgi:hypothetical protein
MAQHHTPGPWTVSEPTGAYIQSAAGGIAALTYGAREADARLIAAAPDMLAALYKAQVSLCGAFNPRDRQALAAINDAIAKATGV